MILFHGSNVEIDSVDLSRSRKFKDFGQGFYLTSMLDQAKKMAARTSKFYGGAPVVTSFEVPDNILHMPGLNIKTFEALSEEWAVFIINNRDRYFEDISSVMCNTDCKYDIVYGPVGDDDITMLLRQYTRGYISPEALRDGLAFKRASDQYSFHTDRALAYLKHMGAEYVA